ncbi:MAG: exo-beta-N-acetylmuramidase NamZ family protein, partial [Longimicrobiales bacterium]
RLIEEGAGVLRGLRVGLITNHTGTTADGSRSTIDVLNEHPDLQLVALFSPEHGIRGAAEAGESVASGRDARTGLPIHSLYGETRAPTAAMLEGIDALVFDIQDIGARYYTYIWTMALALQAAAEHDRLFVVLDRPNPIGGTLVHGNVLDPEFATFVGLYPVPMRHGMSVGEMARFINAEYDIGARLHVVTAIGWQRDQWLDQTAMRWQPPSPNMPTLESAAHYPGTCLFEGTNLSVGRGTPAAFQQIGAPWLDAAAVVARLRALRLPGVAFDAVTFTPHQPGDGKYADTLSYGVRYTVTDRAHYDPTHTAIATLAAIQAMHPDSLQFRVSHFDRLAGTDAVRTAILAGASAADITAGWAAQLEAFRARSAPYLLYR